MGQVCASRPARLAEIVPQTADTEMMMPETAAIRSTLGRCATSRSAELRDASYLLPFSTVARSMASSFARSMADSIAFSAGPQSGAPLLVTPKPSASWA